MPGTGLFVTLALAAVAALTAGHALLNKRDSKAAFGWIALCIILPLAGPVIYLIFGINRVSKRAKKLYQTRLRSDSTPSIRDPAGTHFRPLSTVGEKLTGAGLRACHDVRLLENGENLYPAMIEAIDSARSRVLLATYIFDNDPTSLAIVDALDQARRRGVEVKVILDGLGELMSLPRIGNELQRRNINFVRFNPLTLLPPALNINMRNHRKLLIVDSQLAFTGGQNIGDRHLAERLGNPHRVQDIHFRLSGKIVDELEWAFWTDWHYCHRRLRPEPFTARNENRQVSPTWSRLVLDGPHNDEAKLNDLMVGVISAARQKVWITNPYFLPTADLMGAIMAAHLRGVDVRILLPGQNNIQLAHWATRNAIRPLLQRKIAIYYQPPPFSHSKLLIIDDFYALIGSANMDPRSLRLNYELGVELFSQDVNTQISDYFRARLNKARQVHPDDILKRPLLQQIRDSLAWLFSPYL